MILLKIVLVTTLQPNIGVIQYPDFRLIKMADLPGLIEGASHDVGMGHSFLKHVERSSLLLMVVDIEGFQLSPQCKWRSCIETVFLLNKVRHLISLVKIKIIFGNYTR